MITLQCTAVWVLFIGAMRPVPLSPLLLVPLLILLIYLLLLVHLLLLLIHLLLLLIHLIILFIHLFLLLIHLLLLLIYLFISFLSLDLPYSALHWPCSLCCSPSPTHTPASLQHTLLWLLSHLFAFFHSFTIAHCVLLGTNYTLKKTCLPQVVYHFDESYA